MNKIELFPVSFYEFDANSKLLAKILASVTSLDYIDNNGNRRSKTDLFYDSELFDWFNSCIAEAGKDIGLPDPTKLVITSCWVNKNVKLHRHHRHRHPNSFLSGVFYLTSHSSDGNINFFKENNWFANWDNLQIKGQKNKEHVKTFYPKEGKLILFPSHIEHEVKSVKDHTIRYSISFNTFFSEIIDNTDETFTRLELRTKSVKDHYET